MFLQNPKKQIHILSFWYSILKADNHQQMQHYFSGLYIPMQDGVRDYQGETAIMIHSVQERRLGLTGSNLSTSHILVLI